MRSVCYIVALVRRRGHRRPSAHPYIRRCLESRSPIVRNIMAELNLSYIEYFVKVYIHKKIPPIRRVLFEKEGVGKFPRVSKLALHTHLVTTFQQRVTKVAPIHSARVCICPACWKQEKSTSTFGILRSMSKRQLAHAIATYPPSLAYLDDSIKKYFVKVCICIIKNLLR